MKWVVLGLFLLLPALVGASFASTVHVTAVSDQTQSAFLTYVYFETASGSTSATPIVNTAQTPSGAATSFTVASGSTDYLWSTKFTSAATISAGNWVLDVWASGSSSTLSASIVTTTSTGTVQTTIVTGLSGTMTATKTQYPVVLPEASVTVPANGYIRVAFAASGGSAKIYWGSGQRTNFQVPYRVLTT